jgi:hypothetical protein
MAISTPAPYRHCRDSYARFVMRRYVGILAVLAGIVAIAGAGLAVTSGGGSPEPQGNVLVNREGLIDVSNSPTVATNPAREGNVVVTYRKDRPGYDALISYSFNGGQSWEQSVLPLPQGITGCTASQGAPCPFAPDVAFAPDGTLYVVYVNLVGNGNRPDNLWISTSTDGGRTLAMPTRIAGPLTFQQRVTVDPDGPVYVTWLQAAEVGFLRFADPPPRIVAARSDDRGATFGAPVPVSDASRPRVLAPSPVIDADGQLVVMYQDMLGNRRDYENQEGPVAELPVALVLTRSTDGGRTFGPGQEFETEVLLTRRFLPFLPEGPQLAISPKGTLYAAWADGRDGDDDVFLRSSTDGGQTWAPAVKVNDNPADGTAQFLPKVAVGPGERVSLVFLDGRSDPGANARLEAWLATSTDGGKTFENLLLSTKTFDESIGPTFGDAYGTDFGTRLGLAAGDGTLYAAWVDTSAGTPATGRQDVNFAAIDVPSDGTSPVLAGAVAVALMGAGVALVLARRARTDPATPSGAENRQVVPS